MDELEEVKARVPWFGYNHFNVAAIYDEDYLWGSGTIRQRVEGFLAAQGVDEYPARIQLVTSARHFGYAFNPANFYFCYDIV